MQDKGKPTFADPYGITAEAKAAEVRMIVERAEARVKMLAGLAETADYKVVPGVPSTKTTFDNDPFDSILAEMSALHNKKGKDYGGATDPYANVRASAEFGVAPWIGALIRLNDKITRLKSFIRRGELANESALDSIQDIAVYAVIMRVLYEEENGR